MRVTGGIFKGRQLRSAPGNITRPTTDKIRQAIFNILMNDIEGRSVLDLFAGSGALGIEAISRGAESVVFVEIGRRQCAIIRINLENLEMDWPVMELDFRKAGQILAKRGRKFDVIFADPPYNKFPPLEVVETIRQYDLLAPNGFLIIEHNAGANIDCEHMAIIMNRKFGQTEVTIYVKKKE
jgi:16S rRNA (guanine966-N2)-methyltransferase